MSFYITFDTKKSDINVLIVFFRAIPNTYTPKKGNYDMGRFHKPFTHLPGFCFIRLPAAVHVL